MERKLAAILCADVYGYSRLMGENEEATLHTLTSHRKLIDFQIEHHRGRFVNSAGDSVLAEFASVVDAVNCAVEIQTNLKAENESLAAERRMEFRIGVNLGDVMVEGDQIHGDGVDVAARLENLAEPGGIYVSRTVHENIRNKLPLNCEDLGEQALKNIAEPVRVYRVLLNGSVAALPARLHIPRKYRRIGALSFVGLAIIIGTIVLVQHLSLKPQTTHASIPPLEKPPPPPLPSIPSIAVLPFTNLSGDPSQEYLSNGVSEQLINDLSRLPGLFVIARNSSFAYKGKDVREHQIGTELGVKYLLEGSVQNAADRVRIEVQLVDASSGTEEWTQRFDRPFTDIFAMQDEIIGKVVTTVGLISNLDRLKLGHLAATPSTGNLEAYQDFLRALEYYRRFTKDDNAQARQWLDKAIALDPKFSAAYSFLGTVYWIDVWSQWSVDPQGDLERSAELAHKALSLDDSNSDALALLSRVDWLQRKFDQAVIDAQRAVAINPNSAVGYAALADAESSASRPEESLHAAEQAIRLDPAARDLDGYMLGTAYAEMRRYPEAVAVLKRCISAYPTLLVAHFSLLATYSEMGDDQGARAEAAEVMRISPHFVLSKQGVFKDAAANERWYKSARKAGLK